MSDLLSGASRVHFIVGDPIAQVKSPSGVTQAFHERGLNAFVMPAHVAPADLSAWLAGDGWRRIWDVVNVLTPGGHRQALWWNDAAHVVPATAFLLTLAAMYMLAGYARFAGRDL